ncbi:MAG: lysozyme inhibitor LprI family protein [Pseudomonadota bacterium]
MITRRGVGMAVALWAAATGVGVTQDLPPESQAALEACYYGAEETAGRSACKDLVFDRCQSQPNMGTTLGMMTCAQHETQAWDVLLNAEYAEALAWAKGMDAQDQQHFPEFAKRAESLLAAQRAWIAFRDAECGLAYAVWGAGSMRTLAGTACHADMTAERTLALRALRDEML